MPAVIYTNQASLMAQKGLLGAQNSLANSVERLSSGLRINRAKDDAAGLGVGETCKNNSMGLSRVCTMSTMQFRWRKRPKGRCKRSPR